jgi:TetR/AcrR family transcriptional regulator, fatty acid metabolism regulator protein
MTKRQAQAQKTKSKIYKVAAQLMDKKGFNNTTIEEISKKAKVSVGTFYLYYRSKDEIFQELFYKADTYFKKQVSPHLKGKNALDQIATFFQYYARYNQARGLDAIRQLYNTKNKLFVAKNRYMHLLLMQLIEAGQQQREIIPDDTPQNIADCLFIMARGVVYDWCLHDADYDLEEVMIRHVTRLLSIFKKDSAPGCQSQK